MRQRVGSWRRWIVVSGASVTFGCGGSDDQNGTSPATAGVPHPGSLLVLDSSGKPSAGLRVEVAGNLLTTDAHGSATLPTLPPSYDFVTRIGQQVLAYEGLTSRGPTVKLRIGMPTGTPSTFGLEIDATPGTQQTMLLATDIDGAGIEHAALSGSPSSLMFQWYGAAEATVAVDAFLVDLDPSTAAIVNYAGFAHETWAAMNGGSANWKPVFAPLTSATTTIHVETSTPAGITVPGITLARLTAWGAQGFFAVGQTGASADLLVPTTPAYRYELIAQGSDGQNTSSGYAFDVTPGAKVTIAVPRAPAAIAPLDGVMGVNVQTEFSWTAVDDAIYELDARSDQPQYWFQVFTTGLAAHLPDTSALGLELPQGPDFTWSARSMNHVSLDAYAAATTKISGSGSSAPRTFTTALPP